MSTTISEISPAASTLASLSERAVTEINDALTGSGDAVGSARSAWGKVSNLPQKLDDLLNGRSDINPIVEIHRVLTDPQLSESGREQKIKAITDRLAASANDMAAQIEQGLDAAEQQLRAAALPPRPAGADAAIRTSEAKSDLRMVLDAIEKPSDALNKAKTLLTRALTAGDDATAYIISSPWLLDYFEARWPNYVNHQGDNADGISGAVGQILDEHASPSVKKARAALASISGRYGGMALRQSLGQLPTILKHIEREARHPSRRR